MKRLFVLLGAAFVFLFSSTAVRASAPSPTLIHSLVQQAPGLRSNVLRLAMEAADRAAKQGLITRRDKLTVIDYSLPSTVPRLFVFDLAAQKLLFCELVAHGKNSGGNHADFFSNEPNSEASSLGLFVTANPYFGSHGLSLRLRGLEHGINDMAWNRDIVMHGAAYVSEEAIRVLGRLGRSWGCPAVPQEVASKIIKTIEGGTPLFAYYPAKQWLETSAFLHP